MSFEGGRETSELPQQKTRPETFLERRSQKSGGKSTPAKDIDFSYKGEVGKEGGSGTWGDRGQRAVRGPEKSSVPRPPLEERKGGISE